MYNQYEGKTNNVCPKYSCTNATGLWDNNQCVYYNKDIYYSQIYQSLQARACDSPLQCQYQGQSTNFSNFTCSEPPQLLRYPGDYCSENSQCQTKKCSNDRCAGSKYGEQCLNVYSCEPGYYCNSAKLCDKLKIAGEVCTSDSECATFLVCNSGFCTAAYSIEIGVQVVGSATGYNKFCSTGFAMLNETGLYCAEAPTMGNESIICTTNTNCTDTTGVYTKQCVCGFDGNRYCPSFEGDKYLQNAISLYKQLQSYTHGCNSGIGLSAACFEATVSGVLTYNYYYTNITMYAEQPYIENEPSCFKEVYNPAYWIATNYTPQNRPKHHHSNSIIGYGLIALFSLIL